MTLSLKKLLKQLTVLHLCEIDDAFNKIDNILKIFFDKILHTDNIKIARKIYSENIPNLIILDIELKDANGLEFIKQIRAKNKFIPIIIITKNTNTSNLIEAVKLNLIDYLLKPIDINKLIYALNQSAKVILNNGDIVTTINKEITYNYLEKSIYNKKINHKLTKNESRLVELLLTNKNRIIKNEEIKRIVWTDRDVSESAYKSLFNRLSNKIGKDTISNSFGIGYGIMNN
jgi:DNA-binding response OmpR family regulator